MKPLDWIDDGLKRHQQNGLLRQRPQPLCCQGASIETAGKRLINFASNDYLGLAADERLVQSAVRASRDEGVGRGSSPLICGRAEAHWQLEQRLAQFEGTESALLFPSGFAANAGTIPALVDRGDAIYGDEKNHASIIDGCRLSRAEKLVYPHRNMQALEQLLAKGGDYRRRLIVSDTLFSMDGDLAPMPQLAELAERFGAMLMVDEAHATGVFGRQGRGVLEHFAEEGCPGLEQAVHIRVGTLSKAVGSAGGFVCGSGQLIQWLANHARTYIFSTAQPAAVSAAALAALEVIETEPSRRTNLLENAEELRGRLQQLGWDTGDSASQIIPLRIGPAERTMRIAGSLREQGMWVPGIRPPSVPKGESLLRVCLTSGHTRDMIERLFEGLAL